MCNYWDALNTKLPFLVTEISTRKPLLDGERERRVLNSPRYRTQRPAGGLPHSVFTEKKQPRNNENKESNKAEHRGVDVASRNDTGVPQTNLLGVPAERRRRWVPIHSGNPLRAELRAEQNHEFPEIPLGAASPESCRFAK